MLAESRRALIVLTTVAVVLGLSSRATVADIDAADRAFASGDHKSALRLYNAVLENTPDDLHALVRSGLLLSWDGRYKAAAERYDRALAIDPDNYSAALERAKVLSWDKQYSKAETGFRDLLAADLDDNDAKIGLARTLSWSGKQKEARELYVETLDSHPADAMVGVAQTYAWTGERAEARRWYERALTTEPGKKEAILGLAYLDLAAGDLKRAERKVAALEGRFPDDEEVDELREAIRRASAPWVRATLDRLEDSDDNILRILRAEGGLPLPARLDVTFGIAKYDMENPFATATVERVYGVLGWRPVTDHRLAFRIGSDRRNPSNAGSDNLMIGGIDWFWDFRPTWQLRTTARRSTFIYSVDILDGPGNTIDVSEVAVGGRPAERWRVAGLIGAWDVSDGNRRQNLNAGFWYLWRFGDVRLETGYQLRYMNYDENLNSGYFDPQDYIANLAQVILHGTYGERRFYYDVRAEAGLQSFTHEEVDVSNERAMGITALAGFPIGGGASVEAFLTYSDIANQTPGGFDSRQYGVRVRWQGGR